MRKPFVTILLAACLAAQASVASAQPAESPDWPCMQRKLADLSAAALWSGPPIDDALTRWSSDDEVAALVASIAPRRVPMEEAEAAAAAFADGLQPADREKRLTLLFAGLFQTLGRERGEVMKGIERYGRKQKGMAEQIRADAGKLSELRSAATDAQQVAQLNDQLLWETRIFNERRASLSYVCEVPTLIEQRLFALGRAIEARLSAVN